MEFAARRFTGCLFIAFLIILPTNVFAQTGGGDIPASSALLQKVDPLLKSFSGQVWKYFQLYQQIKKQFDRGAKPLLRGLKIATGETVVIDQSLIDEINDQKVKFSKLAAGLSPPALQNPMEGISQND